MRASSLALTIEDTHRSLQHHLREAMDHTTLRSRPRDTYARTDAFVGAVSQHLAAVDEVLLPLVQRRLADGDRRVHAYVQTATALEYSVTLLRGRLYGELDALHASWPRVWTDVRRALARHNKAERSLVAALTPRLDAEDHERLSLRVYRSELKAPTRPHPSSPHTGLVGTMARRMWALADRVWDSAEGRSVPHPVRPRHWVSGHLRLREEPADRGTQAGSV